MLVISRCVAVSQALAAWLLDSDTSELNGLEAQWERQRQRELQEEEAARLLKVSSAPRTTCWTRRMMFTQQCCNH
jgi:hypothetical protein